MIKLVIDHRENELKEHFKNKENIEFSNLDIGDIQFLYKDEICTVIERKNITDLANSIKDGRFREQKLRLLSNIDNNKIIYLIEGNIRSGKIAGLPHTTLISSCINAMIRDNIKVYRTFKISETIEFIDLIFKKLNKEPEKLLDSKKKDNNDYVSSIKLKKKENMNATNCFILQLSQIPGVSLNIAKAIQQNYKNMLELCKKFNDDENYNCSLLKNITFKIKNDKTRKIGKVVSERVYKFLSAFDKNPNDEINLEL